MPGTGFREKFATVSAAILAKLGLPILPSVAGNEALLLGTYRTATFDLLAAAAAHNFNMPLVAGKKFLWLTSAVWCNILTRDAAPTVNLAFNVSQNGVSQQGANSNVTTGNVTPLAAPERVAAGQITVTRPDMTTFPLQANVVTPFSGAGLTACTGFFEIWGYYAD